MEPQELVSRRGEDFWKAHILKSRALTISDEAYCKENGLSKSTFHNYKKRLGFAKGSKARRTAFVKVAALGAEPVKALRMPAVGLPDPKWLAVFVRSLAAEK